MQNQKWGDPFGQGDAYEFFKPSEPLNSFTLGCLISEIFTGKQPDIDQRIGSKEGYLGSGFEFKAPKELNDFPEIKTIVLNCTKKLSEDRCSFEEVVEFFSQLS